MKILVFFAILLAFNISGAAQTSTLGDTLGSFNAGILTPTPDRVLHGIEFADGYFWATGFDPDDQYNHKLYKFSADGQSLVEYWNYGLEFAGWKGLAYDGQYLYVADIDTIRQLDMATGQKTEGRRRGTPNRATVSKRDQILASGMSPLDFMVSVFRDETQPLAVRLPHKIVAHTSSHP